VAVQQARVSHVEVKSCEGLIASQPFGLETYFDTALHAPRADAKALKNFRVLQPVLCDCIGAR
jgi:hypothetical protein